MICIGTTKPTSEKGLLTSSTCLITTTHSNFAESVLSGYVYHEVYGLYVTNTKKLTSVWYSALFGARFCALSTSVSVCCNTRSFLPHYEQQEQLNHNTSTERQKLAFKTKLERKTYHLSQPQFIVNVNPCMLIGYWQHMPNFIASKSDTNPKVMPPFTSQPCLNNYVIIVIN